MKLLAALGAGFDCASKAELEAVAQMGVPKGEWSYCSSMTVHFADAGQARCALKSGTVQEAAKVCMVLLTMLRLLTAIFIVPCNFPPPLPHSVLLHRPSDLRTPLQAAVRPALRARHGSAPDHIRH